MTAALRISIFLPLSARSSLPPIMMRTASGSTPRSVLASDGPPKPAVSEYCGRQNPGEDFNDILLRG